MPDGSITYTDVGFWILVLGAIGGAWWRVEGAIKSAKEDALTQARAAATMASLVQAQLAEHRLHVAETYVTKVGMQEQTAQIITAVNGVKIDVHGLNERIDRILENGPGRTGR